MYLYYSVGGSGFLGKNRPPTEFLFGCKISPDHQPEHRTNQNKIPELIGFGRVFRGGSDAAPTSLYDNFLNGVLGPESLIQISPSIFQLAIVFYETCLITQFASLVCPFACG